MSSQINTLLGVKSHFSIGESVLKPSDIVRIAQDAQQSDVVVCDVMTLNALIEVSKNASETFRPRFGVALRVVDDVTIQMKKDKQPTVYPKVYPQDWKAVQLLFKLLSRGHEDTHFYMVPRLTIDDVCECLEKGNFIVTTGDFYGLMEHPKRALICKRLSDCVGIENFYAELSPVPTGYHDRVNIEAIKLIEKDGYKPLVTLPTLYSPEFSESFEINMAIHKRSSIAKSVFMRRPTYKEFSAHTPDQLKKLVQATAARIKDIEPYDTSVWKKGILNQSEFIEKLTYVWEAQDINLPKLDDHPNAALKKRCAEGLMKRMKEPCFGEVIPKSDYKSLYLPRMKYELGILKDMGFADYFLVVDDLVKWCKKNDILVGPGRGSVGGSLVAYLMGITDVDPIRFGLIFERFINPARNDLPDIDLDFMSSRREDVVDYLITRYGKEHVAGISNYGVLSASSAMKDVGRVHNIDINEILRASKVVPKVHGSPVDLEQARKEVASISIFADDNPECWDHAVNLQGVLRSYGRHAAGTIVAGCDIRELAIVEQRGGNPTINWDMRVAESMGLVKLDILGLSTLDTISRTLDYIKKRHSKDLDILAIPLDDEKTLKMFSEGKTVGVFQFEGGAARRILKDMSKVNPITFDDIVAANALNRPGPIDAGLVGAYVGAKNEEFENELEHPNMEAALGETYNVIVFQEQVMRVAVDLCGFSFSEADVLRKAMGKKDRDLMAKVKKSFVDGAEKHSGMDPLESLALFEKIEVFAGYAFNKSHAAEYSLISYQCMWLKAHYPIEFFAAALSTVGQDKLKPIIKDALERGIDIYPPDINKSEALDFVIDSDEVLLTPFSRIKRAGGRAPEVIMAIRSEGPITSIENLKKRLTEKKLGRYCNKRVIENLDLVGAFSKVEPMQEPATAENRIKDQLVLMPGLVTRVLRADRIMPTDVHTKARLTKIVDDYRKEDPGAICCEPGMGKKPVFMVVADCPSWSEEKAGQFTKGKSFDYVRLALKQAKVPVSRGYWTGLLKRQKDDKMISMEEIKMFAPYLDKEIELFKPQLIVTLGSTSARHFIDIKGSIMDHIGSTHFLPDLDATLLVGFNPAMIFHDNDKMEDLTEVFKQVKEIIG